MGALPPLLIAGYDVGVQQDVKPFMLPEKAFPDLLNCFVFRDRVERKGGYSFLGRLRRLNTAKTGTTLSSPGAGTVTYNILTALGILATQPNAQVEIGSKTNITITIGAPISQTLTDTLGTGTLTITGAGPITAASINYSTGLLTLTFSGAAPASAVTLTYAYYPGLPVMGICTRQLPSQLNLTQTIFFDTMFAYQFTSGTFSELPSLLPTTWSGDSTELFWSTNFQKNANNFDIFWETNNNAGFHGYSLSAATAANPIVLTTIVGAPVINLGDTIYLYNMSNPNFNFATGLVTNVVGNTITTNIDGSTFGAAAVSGLVMDQNINVTGDGIRYYTGTTAGNATWQNFNPLTNGTNAVLGALIILPFKERLLIFNTQEGNDPTLASINNFRQRLRWSQNGSVIDVVNGWRDDIVGRGGFVDAATDESIVSVGFNKDDLIVYFERSTWQVIYTGNEILPFTWQRINAELGAESTFSAVTFDKGLLAFGNVGVHACNSVQCQRIDQVIPDEIFNIHQNVDGPKRTCGIRDFFKECAYFSYVSDLINTSDMAKVFFPNKIMVYNYRNNTFSFFDDNVTCFGYFQRTNSLTWGDLNENSQYAPWSSWNINWGSGSLQSGFPSIAFGNQQGFVETIEPEDSSNGESLMITNIVPDSNPENPTGSLITSPQHNLFVGQYITINNCIGATNLNGISAEIIRVDDANTFAITNNLITGTYIGNGVLTVITNVSILTKAFTPFWTKGKNYTLKYIDMLFDTTGQGELTVNVFVDFSNNNSMTDTTSGVILGSNVVSTAPEAAPGVGQPVAPYYAFQKYGQQIWKRFYTFATGETFQVQLTFSDPQLTNPGINEEDVVLHAMIFHFDEAGAFY